MGALSDTWIEAARQYDSEVSNQQEADVSEDVFDSNVDVPPTGGNFDEYFVPEGDAVEKAQSATHKLRAKRASLLEQREQFEAKIREYQFAIAEIDLTLGE